MFNRFLNVNFCDVTDAGIVALCGGETDEEDQIRHGNIGQCKSIQKLVILYTKITHNGVQVALRNLPDLKILKSQYLLQALAEMPRISRPASKYALTAFSHIYYSTFIPGSISFAVSLCPLVTKVVLNVESLTVEELLSLLALERLCELDIKCYHAFTFAGGIAPVLKAHENSLNIFKLAGFEVDLGLLIELCPNVRDLRLDCLFTSMRQNEVSPKSKRAKTDIVLSRLEKLVIVGTQFPVSSENLLFLLSAAPALTYLEIHFCPSLTDEVLRQIIEFNLLPCLRNFRLNSCKSVTKNGIDWFMNERNVLEFIFFWGCDLITKLNVEEWENNAKRNNWNLSLMYS